MKILCVIPSRIGSTRLANKALLPIKNKPMVQLVYENASLCKVLDKIIVATDSKDIMNVINNANGEAIMTDANLPTGSDRVAEVAKQFPEMDVVINLQGDEPFVTAKMLEQLVEPYLKGESPAMTTLASKFNKAEDYNNPCSVKVLTDKNYNAIYFSRSPIPYFRENISAKIPVYRHMGLYAFNRNFLLEYTKLPSTPLEQTESLEQLRVLEHGYDIRVCLTENRTLEVNTPEEYEQALLI